MTDRGCVALIFSAIILIKCVVTRLVVGQRSSWEIEKALLTNGAHHGVEEVPLSVV